MRGTNLAGAKKPSTNTRKISQEKARPPKRSRTPVKRQEEPKKIIIKTPQKPQPQQSSRRERGKDRSRSKPQRAPMRYAIPPAAKVRMAPALVPTTQRQRAQPAQNPTPTPSQNAPRSRSISSKISQNNHSRSRSERPSQNSLNTQQKPKGRQPRTSAPSSSYKPLLQAFTPQKMNEVIVEELTPIVPIEIVPVVPDEYEGIPRAKITIPTRRPFGFTR